MPLDLTVRLIMLFLLLFIVGTLLCLQLYKWNFKRFFSSLLWTKIVYWIPIFSLFLIVLHVGPWAALGVVIILIALGLREYRNAPSRGWLVSAYLLFFIASTFALFPIFVILDADTSINLLIVVCFASVLSDVFAFFLGNYFGSTKLPSWINNRKSWEGVGGQIIGAFVGFIIVSFVIPTSYPWMLALCIGSASALGDIFNSIVKRSIGIKDWGTTIPGHGGILDRFSSLSSALLVSFVYAAIML